MYDGYECHIINGADTVTLVQETDVSIGVGDDHRPIYAGVVVDAYHRFKERIDMDLMDLPLMYFRLF